MPKKIKFNGKNKDNKDMAKISICCIIVCLILSLLYMLFQKYILGKDKPFEIFGL